MHRTKISNLALFLALILCASSSSAQETRLPFKTPANYLELPPSALVETTKGKFEIELYRKSAPLSVKNFEYIARQGLYIDSLFSNLKPGRLIQAGKLNTNKKQPRYLLPPEISDLIHLEGSIAMAAPPRQVNPQRLMDNMQFYICLKRIPSLDGQYSIFARVIWGMEVLRNLQVGDRILSIKFPKSYLEKNPRRSERE